MQQTTAAEPFQYLVVGSVVHLRRRSLESVNLIPRDVQTEQCIYSEGDASLWKLQVDNLVYGVRDKIRTVFARRAIGRVEGASTGWTSVAPNDVTSDPPLYPMPHKSKVDYSSACLAMRINQGRFAGQTR